MPTSTANYLTTDAQGRVSAQFEGHVAAAGVDLIAGGDLNPPNDRRVRWHKDTYTGAVVAEFVTSTSGGVMGGPILQENVYGDGAGSAVELFTQDNSLDYSTLRVQAKQGDTTLTKVGVEVDGQIRTIINGAGQSDFQQANATIALWGGTGPAPGSTNIGFNVTRSGYYTAFFQPSGYSPAAVGLALASMLVDGVEKARCQYFFNVTGDHRTFPPAVSAPFLLLAGVHTWAWTVPGGIPWTQDVNDATPAMLYAA